MSEWLGPSLPVGPLRYHQYMGYNLCICGNRKKYSASQCRVCRYGVIGLPREDITEVEVAWVAGILEGEGCWTTKSAHGTTWWIAVRMTDQDVVQRLAELTGIGTLCPEPPQRPGAKPSWSWRVAAKPHREWLTLKVWPWLGQRRRARVKELWPEVNLAPQAFSGDVPAFQAG